jgi:hypothetical protein
MFAAYELANWPQKNKVLPFNDCLRAVVNYKEKMIPTRKLILTKLCIYIKLWSISVSILDYGWDIYG